MANKKALLGAAQIDVARMSGFDKSRFHGFTAPLGAIVPMAKQLLIPGRFRLSVRLSAQLPPLATDAFLRTHLKVEAFLVPMRLCSGSFDSWYSGSEVYDPTTGGFTRAKLPRIFAVGQDNPNNWSDSVRSIYEKFFGAHSLMDYFGVKPYVENGSIKEMPVRSPYYNIFPFLAYQLCYHHYYRNKLIEKPLFAPRPNVGTTAPRAASLPWECTTSIVDLRINGADSEQPQLLNGGLLDLRYRNYGFDYFTTALPSPQEGSPMSIDTSSGAVTISAIRLQNAAQHFAEVNQLAGPDMVQVNKARYGVDLSDGVAQRPILLGSADFPMFTSGVEQTAQGSDPNSQNPFSGMASRYGRAHAEGSDFVCEGQCKEPSYLLVMCSLVPEANYANGVEHDMRIFTEEGSLVDLPVSMLEATGYEPIYEEEVSVTTQDSHETPNIFGYQPRYMWHKAGARNMVSGLFRKGYSLASFIPQRVFANSDHPVISTDFLKVSPSDLDGVMAVAGELSRFGVMIDSAIDLKVSEPLGESVLPSLVDPASEHGYTVYVKRGGISVND